MDILHPIKRNSYIYFVSELVSNLEISAIKGLALTPVISPSNKYLSILFKESKIEYLTLGETLDPSKSIYVEKGELDANLLAHIGSSIQVCKDAFTTPFKALKKGIVPIRSAEVLSRILSNEDFFVQDVKNAMSENRYIHSLNVSKLCLEISKIDARIDPYKACIAGLFHDITKEMKQFNASLKPALDKKYGPRFDSRQVDEIFLHQFSAPIYLKEKGIDDSEILRGIRYHTSGCGKMSLLGKLVFAADKIEPSRGYDSAYMICELKRNIEEGFALVLKENEIYLQNRGVNLFSNSLTRDCYAVYRKEK